MKCITRKVVTGTLLLASLLTGALYPDPSRAATLLPNGEQTFVDQNGLPIANGCVYFYQPGTTTPKDTYLDPGAVTTNTNPVVLDAAGRAIIYGAGSYRQVVQKASSGPGSCLGTPGAQVWDQLTADSSAGNTIYAGASSGTPNAITVTAPAFTGTDGQVINYYSTNTNTAAATLNPSSFGAVQIVRDSATGPGVLTGGELVATNAVSLIYDASGGVFHILSPVNWPNTSGVPVGTVIHVAGFAAPTNYAFAYGQAVSRAAFPSLFSALTTTQTGSLSSGSPIITGLTDTTQFGRAQPVESIGIPTNTVILSCTSTTCTMSANATTTRSGTITFFAYGDGDGSVTFNLPDFRGDTLFARDNMGGTAANVLQITTNLTTTSGSATATVASAAGLALGMSINSPNVPSGAGINAISGTTITMSANASATASAVAARFAPIRDAQALGVPGGALTGTLVTANLPPYTPSGTITNGAISFASMQVTSAATGANQGFATGASSANADMTNRSGVSQAATNFAGSPQNGTSVPISNIPPIGVVNMAIRLVP